MDTTHPTHAASTETTNHVGGRRLPDALRLGPTRLIVTDQARSIEFYERVIGLRALGTDGDGIARLGTADGTIVLELDEQPGYVRAGAHAGLYHVALLYPSRVELARAIERIAATGTMIDGAADHGTHEAIYLPDPDGNGLELAADRPAEVWPDISDVEELRPRPLDVHALLELVEAEPGVAAHAADGLVVGHLHLHVGDIPRATEFWVDVVGFDVIARLPVAAFVSAGGYHHHLAFNTWRGVGVPAVPDDALGMRYFTAIVPSTGDLDAIEARLVAAAADHERRDPSLLVLRDPWRNELHVVVDAEVER